MADKKDDRIEKTIFSLEEAFPDAEGIFSATYQKLKNSYKSALLVFDTNVLLLPYSMRNEGLEQLKGLYKSLISEKRLYIPKRVVREFAKNRNKKLAEIYNSLMQEKSGKTKSLPNYPIIDSLEEKTKLNEALEELRKAESRYFKAIDALASTVRGWEWNDPVSSIYSELFSSDILIDHEKNKEDLIAELGRRCRFKIPPGYKDSSKDDGGIGDLAIWMSLLKLGERTKKDTIFVTEDVKPDWWNQSSGAEFLPRYELIDEFRRASGGHTIHIIRFSRLLELFEMEHELIEAAKKAELEKKERLARLMQRLKEERRRKRNIYRHMPREDQLAEVKKWFFSKYEDPVESCPYESREGGYQYIWGGPYDAREEIESEFGEVVDESVIDEVVSELEDQCWEWSGRSDEYLDEPY